MTEESAPADKHPAPNLWLEPLALVASVVAIAAGGLLCAAVRSWLGPGRSWPQLSEHAALALMTVWLAAGLGGIICGLLAKAPARRRRTRVVVAVVVSVLALLAVPGGALDLVLRGGPVPSDAALIKNFREHEAGFAALADHLQTADSVGNAELGALGVKWLNYFGPDYFELDVVSWGIVPSGWAKGYVYSMQALSPTVDDLDRHAQADGATFRHIKGSWYLSYEVW